MKPGLSKRGFTLIEMMVVIAIIVILISMVVGVTKRLDDQSKIRLCRDTLALIDNALEQFRDFGFEYKHADYAGLTFPLDCNNFNAPDFTGTIQKALDFPLLSVSINPPDSDQIYNSGSEALYFFLNQVPDCRSTLDKIDKSLKIDKDKNGNQLVLLINNVPYCPLTRIIDPWKMPLRYDYYTDYADYILLYPTGNWLQYLDYRNLNKLTFPIITSAGPDKLFGTKDDISNRQQK